MTHQQRETLRNAKGEASRAKSELLRILDKVQDASPREARRLETIIGKLETWQNTGAGA